MKLTCLIVLQFQLAFLSCWQQSKSRIEVTEWSHRSVAQSPGGLFNVPSALDNVVKTILRAHNDNAHHGAHRRHQGYHRNPHKSHQHQEPKIKMPSGNSYAIKSAKESKRLCKKRSSLVTLKSNDKKWKSEYNIVKKEIDNTNKNSNLKFKIIKIQKVFNPCLWKKYKYRRGQIYSEAKTTNEHILFYGSKIAHDLAIRGFDERYSGHKGKFGAGFSFTAESSRSHDISGTKARRDGTYQMLLCRVILGKVHKDTSTQIYAHAPVGYHSVEGDIGGQSDYVVYRGEQVYPEYLVTYKK